MRHRHSRATSFETRAPPAPQDEGIKPCCDATGLETIDPACTGMRRVFVVSTLQNISGTITLAGAGKMGSAMLTGWLARGLEAKRVTVIEPAPSPDIAAL